MDVLWDINLKYQGSKWFGKHKDEFKVPIDDWTSEGDEELFNYADSIALKFIYTYALQAWNTLKKREPTFTKETLQKIEDDYKKAYFM